MKKKDIIQFGTGNFLRGFSCWMVQQMKDQGFFKGDIFMIQSHGDSVPETYQNQNNQYHVMELGVSKGKEINQISKIDCIKAVINAKNEPERFLKLAENPGLRFVISNTTEAGIFFKQENPNIENVFPVTFPGKLTALLYIRFSFFEGELEKGLIIFPCELIQDNGAELKKIVLKHANSWSLPKTFLDWLDASTLFCNTLVDRIVPGFPKENMDKIRPNLEFEDELLVMTEPYHFWAIEGDEKIKDEFPAEKAGLQVNFVKDLSLYRKRKVRVLNGAHTAMVPMAYLKGLRTVIESIEHQGLGQLISDIIFKEIIPVLGMPEKETEKFALDVIDRFRNPFIRHELLSIALNSISKFKIRVLPSMVEFYQINGFWPPLLCQAMADLLVFYSGMDKEGKKIPLKDDLVVISIFSEAWEADNVYTFLQAVLSQDSLWGEDLSFYASLTDELAEKIDYQSHKSFMKK
ncbi:MAG: tagaturonate reductase [Mongoliibacter sp.]|uniref:tagaturonate reductase n=1 Tax=Mongoliibacter sp. TaxID=2022438 RepID=UPI0012F09D59|nr:tagaturonate reductase [Mongoliibacter sp.]TVP51407.1 MAG: tagaturonate reductase [Mongoliibacter sp.]